MTPELRRLLLQAEDAESIGPYATCECSWCHRIVPKPEATRCYALEYIRNQFVLSNRLRGHKELWLDENCNKKKWRIYGVLTLIAIFIVLGYFGWIYLSWLTVQ